MRNLFMFLTFLALTFVVTACVDTAPSVDLDEVSQALDLEKFCERHPNHKKCTPPEEPDAGQVCVILGELCNDDVDVCCDFPDVDCRFSSDDNQYRCRTAPVQECDTPYGSPCDENSVCCGPGGAEDPNGACSPNQDNPNLPGECGPA